MVRQIVTKRIGSAFGVTIVPTMADNFSYVIEDYGTGAVAAVDVNADVQPVLDYMNQQNIIANNTSRFNTILTTHRHWDHSGGNLSLRDMYMRLCKDNCNDKSYSFHIYGGCNENVPGCTHPVKQGDNFAVGDLRVDVYDVPCHTRGHVMYNVYHPQHVDSGSAVFTGDTLFIGGVGAFFEGNAKDMYAALKKLYDLNATNNFKLDPVTYLFPGHEYTAMFMRFSERVLCSCDKVGCEFVRKQAQCYANAVAQGLPSVPSTLADEKRQNTFLRATDSRFQTLMGKGSGAQLMEYLYNDCD